jgi:lipopolysaccharide biosynthesis glycosyltransferase
MPDLVLAMALDERYLTPARVTIASLVAHLPDDARPVLHLVTGSLPHEAVASMSSLVETCVLAPPGRLAATIPSHPRFPPETAYLLFLPELLPDGDRVLFLDADLLVCDDVTPLWQTDLSGRAVAAVPDAAVERCDAPRGVRDSEALGIPSHHRYFNGGVLLIDLDAWRARDVAGRTLAYLRTHPDSADFLHQEAMNAALWDDWLELDRRWNLLGSVAGRGHEPHEAASAGIVHFAGRMKPWLAPVGGPFEAPYRETLAMLGVDRPPPDLRRRALSLYDRSLRDLAYPLEHRLWSRGWI